MSFTLIDRTEFRLLQRILTEGADAVRPVLEQRRDLGFNCARVLSQCDLMFRLNPRDYADEVYDGAVIQMIELLAEHGNYINFVCYADERNIASGQAHWMRLGRLMQSKPGCGILSAVNEADQTVNQVPFLSSLQKIDGVICTRGSNGGSYNLPPMPHMDAGEVHLNGQSEWHRKTKNPDEDIIWPNGIPAWSSESNRPDQDNVIGHHEDAAGIGALLTGGYTFHCQEGKYSDIFGPSLPFAQAVVARIRAIDPKFYGGCPLSQYRRVDDPSVLRRYGKQLQDGSYHEETARLP